MICNYIIIQSDYKQKMMRPKENLRPQSHKLHNSLLHKRLALLFSHCLNHSIFSGAPGKSRWYMACDL
jgi:hypothetical protein